MQATSLTHLLAMSFPQRLTALRKQQGFTQHGLADAIGVSLSILKRYEAGLSQPTLPVLRKLAVTLGVSADVLLFDKDERGPDDDLRLHFETLAQLPDEDKNVIKALIEGLIAKHRARQIVGEFGAPPPSARAARG
jgi:transcriptional regulator with XRE-family HTH domain